LPAIFRAAAENKNAGKMPALRLPNCHALDAWVGLNRDAKTRLMRAAILAFPASTPEITDATLRRSSEPRSHRHANFFHTY
jgi:hypothetical protein